MKCIKQTACASVLADTKHLSSKPPHVNLKCGFSSVEPNTQSRHTLNSI